MWPVIDSVWNRNEYQQNPLRGEIKSGRCLGFTTVPHSRAKSLEIFGPPTSWNPKGFSRPVVGYVYLFLFILK
jgi:hypothetical protein